MIFLPPVSMVKDAMESTYRQISLYDFNYMQFNTYNKLSNNTIINVLTRIVLYPVCVIEST